MEQKLDKRMELDDLADAAGGYFAMPTAEDLAYTELLFDVCRQFGIRYYSATAKERAFVEEVTRVTWAKQQEAKTGAKQKIRPAFAAKTPEMIDFFVKIWYQLYDNLTLLRQCPVGGCCGAMRK